MMSNPQHHALRHDSFPETSTSDGSSMAESTVWRSQFRSEADTDTAPMTRGKRYPCSHPAKITCRPILAQGTNCSRLGRSLYCSYSEGRSSRESGRFMHTLSSFHLPLLSPRWFLLACSSLLILLSSIKNVSGTSVPDTDDVRRKFLRNSATSAGMIQDDDAPSAIDQDDVTASRRMLMESSLHDRTDDSDIQDDDEDYEKRRLRLNIPLPAVGASLMGLLKGGDEDENDLFEGHMFAYAGTNEAMKRLASIEDEESSNSRRNLLSDEGRDEGKTGFVQRLFAFAGTNQAIKNLASAKVQDDAPMERGRRMLLPIGEEELILDSTSYTATILQIAKSRSSLLWGPEAESEMSADDEVDLSTLGSSLHAFKTPRRTAPMLERSTSDLDRGRYLVGLKVRDIQPHQQIPIDYDTAANDGSETKRQPIRVRYTLSQDAAGANADELLLLSQLLETSFLAAAEAWSRALRVTPVSDAFFPTVETCGAATIPAYDRENGIEDADIVIYVSSDNRFCGGALMHSAVCDFDQFTRPLVGNINICTKNFPERDTPQGRKSLEDITLIEYASYLTTETGRILGASTSLFRYFLDPQTMSRYGTTEKRVTCVDGQEETLEVPNIIFEDVDKAGNRSYGIRTPRVTEMVRNHFDCMVLTGARLEQGKDSIGCFGGFLDDHLFYSEEMTGFEATSTKGPSISPLTLALLEDSSWYIANYKISVEKSFGRSAGCQFARSGCLFDEKSADLDDDYSAFHCTEIGEVGCDASHSHKAKCDFLDSTGQLSSGINSFCPMYTRQAISCTGSADPLAIQGEYYGESSKCFHTDKGEPMCLRGECNVTTRTIDVYYEGEMFSCHKGDQIIDTLKGLQIKCPSSAAVCPNFSCPSNCSGKGVCDKDKDGKHACICDDPFDESPGCYGEYLTDEL